MVNRVLKCFIFVTVCKPYSKHLSSYFFQEHPLSGIISLGYCYYGEIHFPDPQRNWIQRRQEEMLLHGRWPWREELELCVVSVKAIMIVSI